MKRAEPDQHHRNASGGSGTQRGPAPSPSLEDRVFGPARSSPPPPGGAEWRGPPSSSGPDPVTRCMLPSVLAVVAAAVVVWSITKSVQYSELFQVNARYQYGLCAVNAAVVVLAVAIVAVHPSLAAPRPPPPGAGGRPPASGVADGW